MKNLKIAALGMIAAMGLATTAFAQQSSTSMPGMTAEQHRQMMAGADQKDKGAMMNHGDMAKMMEGCEKMMKMMDSNSAAPAAKR